MASLFIGIDPGLTAGVALVKDGKVLYSTVLNIIKKEDVLALQLEFGLHRQDDIKVACEATAWRASATKRCPKLHCGVLLGVLGLQGMPLVLVQPGTWRKEVLGNREGDKNDAIKYCKQLEGLGSISSHDEAEAVCIAIWAASQPTSTFTTPKP